MTTSTNPAKRSLAPAWVYGSDEIHDLARRWCSDGLTRDQTVQLVDALITEHGRALDRLRSYQKMVETLRAELVQARKCEQPLRSFMLLMREACQ